MSCDCYSSIGIVDLVGVVMVFHCVIAVSCG